MGVYRKILRTLKVRTDQADKLSVLPYTPCPECWSCMECELHLDDCSQRLTQQNVTSRKPRKASKNAKAQL